jgi:hypothetical protein
MKKAILYFLVAIGIIAHAQSPVSDLSKSKDNNSPTEKRASTEGKEMRTLKHNAFKPGEVLEWVVHYGFIDAGIARIELRDEGKTIAGRKVYHVIGTGETKGAFDWFYKVRDRYETYIDAEGVFPWLFVRRVDEGGYLINQDYKFFQYKNQVDNGAGKTFETPDYVQDMISAVYFARTWDMKNAKPGDIFSVKSFVDNEIHDAKVRYIGTETISIRGGKYNCLKFNPIVQQGRIFKKESDMIVYITNDDNKIPILVEAKILVGSVKMELIKHEGLANPIAKVK